MNYSIKKCIEVLADAGIKKTDQNLRYAISTGKLKCTKDGRELLISDIELERYLSSLKDKESGALYFDTEFDKIKNHKSLLIKIIDGITTLNKSFTNLSFELTDDFILSHIKAMSHTQSNASYAQSIKDFHSNINIKDAENNPLTKQIRSTGRIANLAAISTLPEFTEKQLLQLDEIVKDYRAAVNQLFQIEGKWLVLVGQHYEVDNLLLDGFLKDHYSIVISDEKEKQCFKAYQELLGGVSKFVCHMDELGVPRPDTLLYHGEYPIDKLISLGTKSTEATARSGNFLKLIRNGSAPMTTKINGKEKVHPSEIKANPNPIPMVHHSSSFKILDVPTHN